MIRTSTPDQEGVYQAAKYLKFQVLCDAEELSQLFQTPFRIYPLTGLVDGEPIEKSAFLNEYGSWIEGLKQGRVPSDAELRRILACAFSAEDEAIWKQEVPGKKYIVKISKPVVQVQAHFFTYSPIDGVFRPMTMGLESIFWGLQLSYPQIYQEPKTMEFREVEDSPNTELFQTTRQWVRNHTLPTPFVVEGKKTNVPIRLGKNCFPWIGSHPQLKKLSVYAN